MPGLLGGGRAEGGAVLTKKKNVRSNMLRHSHLLRAAPLAEMDGLATPADKSYDGSKSYGINAEH